MSSVKGGQQGKGSHAHKGRGAGEARPCNAGALALQGPASTTLIPPLSVRLPTACLASLSNLELSRLHQNAVRDG